MRLAHSLDLFLHFGDRCVCERDKNLAKCSRPCKWQSGSALSTTHAYFNTLPSYDDDGRDGDDDDDDYQQQWPTRTLKHTHTHENRSTQTNNNKNNIQLSPYQQQTYNNNNNNEQRCKQNF